MTCQTCKHYYSPPIANGSKGYCKKCYEPTDIVRVKNLDDLAKEKKDLECGFYEPKLSTRIRGLFNKIK